MGLKCTIWGTLCKKKNYGHESWYKSEHLFGMRKILQQVTVGLIQIPFFPRSLQGIHKEYLPRNASKYNLASNTPSTFYRDPYKWVALKLQLPLVHGKSAFVAGPKRSCLIFVIVIIVLFVISRVFSMLTVFKPLFLNPEERPQVIHSDHFSFNYTVRYGPFAWKNY